MLKVILFFIQGVIFHWLKTKLGIFHQDVLFVIDKYVQVNYLWVDLGDTHYEQKKVTGR